VPDGGEDVEQRRCVAFRDGTTAEEISAPA
jgi:hypothetical protein